MKAGFQAALRAADGIVWTNRRLAFVVRWGLQANAVLIAAYTFSRSRCGRPSRKSRMPCDLHLLSLRLSRKFLNPRRSR